MPATPSPTTSPPTTSGRRPSAMMAAVLMLLGFIVVFVVALTVVHPVWLRIGILVVAAVGMGMVAGALVVQARAVRAADLAASDPAGPTADEAVDAGWLPSQNDVEDHRTGRELP